MISANSSMAAGALFLIIIAFVAAGIFKACNRHPTIQKTAEPNIAVSTNPHISINMATAEKARAGGAAEDTPPPYRFPNADSITAAY